MRSISIVDREVLRYASQTSILFRENVINVIQSLEYSLSWPRLCKATPATLTNSLEWFMRQSFECLQRQEGSEGRGQQRSTHPSLFPSFHCIHASRVYIKIFLQMIVSMLSKYLGGLASIPLPLSFSLMRIGMVSWSLVTGFPSECVIITVAFLFLIAQCSALRFSPPGVWN